MTNLITSVGMIGIGMFLSVLMINAKIERCKTEQHVDYCAIEFTAQGIRAFPVIDWQRMVDDQTTDIL